MVLPTEYAENKCSCVSWDIKYPLYLTTTHFTSFCCCTTSTCHKENHKNLQHFHIQKCQEYHWSLVSEIYKFEAYTKNLYIAQENYRQTATITETCPIYMIQAPYCWLLNCIFVLIPLKLTMDCSNFDYGQVHFKNLAGLACSFSFSHYRIEIKGNPFVQPGLAIIFLNVCLWYFLLILTNCLLGKKKQTIYSETYLVTVVFSNLV